MGILDRARSAAANFVQPRIQASVASVLPGTLLAGSVGNVLTEGLRSGSGQSVRAAIDSARANAPDLLVGELWNRLPNIVPEAAGRQAIQLAAQLQGKSLAGMPIGPGQPSAAGAKKFTPSPLAESQAPVFGGLTLQHYKNFAKEMSVIDNSWKNLFFVKITEMEKPANASREPFFNLLAQDVSFAPVTMPGEAVPLGSAVMDNLSGSERVEISMTILDDSVGSVKRWFMRKSSAAADINGTFGLPADYLVTMEIRHMSPDGADSDSDRMRHRYLVRPSSMQITLSRRAPELEELELTFTEFDTFVLPPL